MAVEFMGGSDIPAPTESSVGSLNWPPKEASEQRKKGVYRSVLETGNDVLKIIEEFMNIDFGINENQVPNTRISARFFTANSALREIIATAKQTGDMTYIHPIEAIVPLAGTGIAELEDCSMVYVGKNDSTRTSDPAQIKKELDDAQVIFVGEIKPSTHTYETFQFVLLDEQNRIDPGIQEQYCMLYQVFGWGPDNVKALLGSKDNVMIAAFKDGELISAGMAERAVIPIQRNGREIPLVMYEITEAATKEENRGNGLYTKVAEELMRVLAQKDAHLVYAESNLLAPGVLRSAHRQGRHTAMETAFMFGLDPRVLEQHVRISGGSRDTRPNDEKNDLLVTFIPRNEILSRYGNLSEIVE